MRRTALNLMVLGTVLLAFAGGCSSKRASRAYHDVVGDTEHEHAMRKVDINTATRGELAKLPGLTDSDADRIIANRPYGDRKGLLRKGVLSERQYENVEDYVFASSKR
jgi:DNA uptake protein ComE-like DNA-binding protein